MDEDDDYSYEKTYLVLGMNTLSGAEVPTTVHATSNIRGLTPPTVERASIGSWNAGSGFLMGQTVVYFNPHTLYSPTMDEFGYVVRCDLSIGEAHKMAADDGSDNLTQLHQIPHEFDVASEAGADAYAQVTRLDITVSLFATDPD